MRRWHLASPHKPSRIDIWPQLTQALTSRTTFLRNEDNSSTYERYHDPSCKFTQGPQLCKHENFWLPVASNVYEKQVKLPAPNYLLIKKKQTEKLKLLIFYFFKN